MTLAPHPSRDRLLERAVLDLLAHDARLSGVEVDVKVDGGVVHLQGEVESQERLSKLRALCGRLREVYAVWDRVRVRGQRELVLLDVGCGGQKQYPESIGLDCVPLPGVDVVCDLCAALPFEDGSVDRIFAVHVLEHCVDLAPVLNELHRILAPGGVLYAMAPDWRSVNAVADPTHVRFFDRQTFKYLCRPSPRFALWRPLHAAFDRANVFADLTPVKGAVEPASPEELAWWFD